ncbi:MAG: class I SAM-dependent methyltransferase [Verrucomicrobiota bacterium]
MDVEKILDFFSSDAIVDFYADASARVGLWRSEEKICKRLFKKQDSILELGCGAGRVAFGLYELGYRNLLSTDYSLQMIKRARHLTKVLEYPIPFRVCDATELEFEDSIFDGAIFTFNGLMQIPKAEKRLAALREIRRVLRPGAWFFFTTHDREASPHQDFWKEEELRWMHAEQSERLDEFGDRVEDTKNGVHFMHVPTRAEIAEVLSSAGFDLEATVMRSELADEPQEVLDFSDDCRFWVVQKPD